MMFSIVDESICNIEGAFRQISMSWALQPITTEGEEPSRVTEGPDTPQPLPQSYKRKI